MYILKTVKKVPDRRLQNSKSANNAIQEKRRKLNIPNYGT
jgi:hypothetical protein